MSPPPAAVQPITGGMAPTTAPTHVLSGVRCFIGVYASVYSPSVAAPRAVVMQLVPSASVARPAAPEALAQPIACGRLMRPDGSGRLCVRFIAASFRVSMIWLKLLAEPASRKVPPSADARLVKSSGPLDMRWPAAVEPTTSALSRLLDSSM